MSVVNVVNGTYIVPYGLPPVFQPDQLDKLGFTGAITLSWPTIVGGFALMFGARNWRQYSYTPLAIAWMWSVSLVAFGIFKVFGIFDHRIVFVAILHIQTEWLIITYLLGYSFLQGYINATVAGFILYLGEVALPGIRLTFLVSSILGGFGDVFIPVLLWHGGKKMLAVGAAAHFLNALVTFIEFVYYLPLELYLSLQLIFGTAHALFTVAGIMSLQAGSASIRLAPDSEYGQIGDGPGASGTNGSRHKRTSSWDGLFKPLIPVPDMKEVVKLALIAGGLSLAASVPLNFINFKKL
ncbi:hypothetical protein DL93DRAFT_346035 [Clavulina sp. PMI_390]|nr:hypothetical protein DL93DRAFT_346035 [Clavulina sp. PMI_390]